MSLLDILTVAMLFLIRWLRFACLDCLDVMKEVSDFVYGQSPWPSSNTAVYISLY